MENFGALIVAILCAGAGLIGLQFVSNPRERMILTRLFLAAFALRLVFTFLLYKTDVVQVLGGADDMGWHVGWERAQLWKHSQPESLSFVYGSNLQRNKGFHYCMAWFYYLLDMRSQMALAFFHCFLNALTVVVIYKSAREFFSEKASLFAGVIAAILPGFMIWSALTVKEPWVIFFEITIFYLGWRCYRDRNLFFGLAAALLIFLMVGFRFYAGWICIAASGLSLLCYRSRSPLRDVVLTLVSGVLVYELLKSQDIVSFHASSIVQERLEMMEEFRRNISTGNAKWGTNSGVQLGYDTSTATGLMMQVALGMVYLLLSPFPWQVTNLRQTLTLPDVLLWWGLLLGFILPGIRYAWQRRPGLVLSIAGFVLPLLVLYALIFANVGLVYRQRAQLMPFLLILAAAGYESRQRRLPRGLLRAAGRRASPAGVGAAEAVA